MDKRCSQGVPALENVVCEDCHERNQLRKAAAKAEADVMKALLADAKQCPGCGALTSRLSGCAHITYTLCVSHLCWTCAKFKASSGREVYEHFHNAHANNIR
mgnify:CR=1 FL=1